MKTIILNETGGVDKLQLTDTQKPQIKSNEVLVKVKAISINPVDVNARAYDHVLNWIYGDIRPVTLGWDMAGEVSEIGEEVTGFKVGDRVFGMVNFFGNGKAYAEYTAAPASHLALIPEHYTFEEAAAATLAAVTAYQALVDVAKIKKNDRVLIHAASGGVGHFAVQIANILELTYWELPLQIIRNLFCRLGRMSILIIPKNTVWILQEISILLSIPFREKHC